ncbi:DUF2171 domain-containing protein [Sphingomonas naphthae]|uniref:DUF2171 domain-containing protein n=1 Tax=Sphingomonas naphthae TaxID=1813468 RepID=A0ABY7TF82_9SPHN|nr:DUF2171 domain-containing protein [Sphingomonas naphthae]WCT71868.1 DUF2171 domain-containing protein [Sphingomonas naphthae]
MGYERNDRHPGEGRWRASSEQGRGYGPPRDRYRSDYGARGDYGRQPQGYDYQDRGFFDRAGDEVRSWFGDDEAERRREYDARFDERYRDRDDRARASRDYYSGYGRDENYADRARRGGGGYEGGFGGGFQTSDFGAGNGAGATGTYGLGAGRDRDTWGRDPNYTSWRDRQMEELDRDYAEYHLENQRRFNDEFGSWRTTRQTQRQSLGQVQEHQEVVGSDGAHIGTVDKIRGDRIILTKTDQDAGGHHHSIPSSWISTVADKVTISKTADQAKAHWRDEERNAGDFWNRSGAGSRNRTPSSTY